MAGERDRQCGRGRSTMPATGSATWGRPVLTVRILGCRWKAPLRSVDGHRCVESCTGGGRRGAENTKAPTWPTGKQTGIDQGFEKFPNPFSGLEKNEAERRETFGCVRGTRWAYHDAIRQALARRLASHNAGRSPLGAPPWRFWASGPRFRLFRRPPSYNGGHLPSGSVQRAPRSQVVVPGGRGPGPPEANSYKLPPQDATPRSAFRMSPDDAPR